MNRLTVPERHQLRIARDTLKMSDAMARVMGGPSKAEARKIIQRLTDKQFSERQVKRNTHIAGKDERTLARLVRRYGSANVLGETHEIAGKRRNPRRGGRKLSTRRRARTRRVARSRGSRRRRNPTIGILAANPRGPHIVKELSRRTYDVAYRHTEDGGPYKHSFGKGVHISLLSDGNVLLWHPSHSIWKRFA